MPGLGDLPSTGQSWDRPVRQGRRQSGATGVLGHGGEETAHAERSGVGETESRAGPRPRERPRAALLPYSFLFTLTLESFPCCSQRQQNKDAKRPADPPGAARLPLAHAALNFKFHLPVAFQ